MKGDKGKIPRRTYKYNKDRNVSTLNPDIGCIAHVRTAFRNSDNQWSLLCVSHPLLLLGVELLKKSGD
jgi:hypothetical protein